MEGLHLRGAPVARGGIRWSERPEDFRTEVLGLLKAEIERLRQARRGFTSCRWSDLPGRGLVKGQQGGGLTLGEVTGAGPLDSHVAPCGLRRGQAVAVRGPGVEQHQAA